MNNSPLDAIKEAEKKSGENIKKAQAEAEKTILKVEKQKQKFIIETERINKIKRDELLINAKDEANKDIDGLLKQEAKEKQKIKQLASKNKEKALSLVIEELLK